MVYYIMKKTGMTHEEFHRYWKDGHGPIAARIPGLRRCVQSHTIARASEIRPPAFDGMAELWFEDFDALLAAMRSPEVQAAINDERNFIDRSRTAFFVTEEHSIV